MIHLRRTLITASPWRSNHSPARTASRSNRAFTLVEVLVATSILGLAVGMTMVVFIAALKRAQHTEQMLKGMSEIRYASDIISQTVRSGSQLPTIAANGTRLLVPPKDVGYALVLDTTWIDMVNGVKGSKSNQKMLHVSNVTMPAVVASVWASTARPAGAISDAQVATYFVDGSNLPVGDLNGLFAVGDTLTIPATAYGPKTTGVINSISNNPGNKTVTLVSALGVDVPNGTKIAATSGRRAMFEVVPSGASTGDLRYYPNSTDLTKFSVLAHNISPTPLSDPSNSGSAPTVPFVISNSSANYVIINLQKLPKGTTVGRTVQGVQTTAYTRTDPTLP
jgi:prepilin-type N-terminal cleavage/methylation domain-containing protein